MLEAIPPIPSASHPSLLCLTPSSQKHLKALFGEGDPAKGRTELGCLLPESSPWPFWDPLLLGVPVIVEPHLVKLHLPPTLVCSAGPPWKHRAVGPGLGENVFNTFGIQEIKQYLKTIWGQGSILHLLSRAEDHPGILQRQLGASWEPVLLPSAHPTAFCFINPFFAP